MARKLFVTTALPYANGPFHIGHIMEYIQADIWVRFQRMLGNAVHFVCADDAHGAPIMLKAEAEHISPQELVARIVADRPRYLEGFHIGFDHWYSTDSPENTALSQDIYRRLKAAGLIYIKAVEQFYDPVKGMFLADRYIKGECPNCHAKDQYADACEVCSIVNSPTDLIDPYSTLSGAKPLVKTSDHYFFRLSDPKCVEFLDRMARHTGTAPAAGGQQGPRVALRIGRGGARRLGYFPRRTLLRDSDPGRARQVLLRVARRAGRLSRGTQELLRYRQGRRSRRAAHVRAISRSPRHRAAAFHRQGHHLLPHAVLARHAEVRGPSIQGARSRIRPRLHHGVRREDVQVPRDRHQPVALSRDRDEPGVAALLHRREAQCEHRGSGLQPRRLRCAREQRSDRQIRQHREPGRELHHQAFWRRARRTAATPSCSRTKPASSRRWSRSTTRHASSAKRCARSWPTRID